MSVVDDVVIRTEQLTKVYPGGLKAVDELDLEVHQGEIFGLLGPNGAGKTTTAGMLTTRVIPTSGRAFVGGIDVVEHPTAAKQVIGVVPQSNTLDRSLTVWENLYFHGRYFGMSAAVARREADRLLEQFRLVRAGARSRSPRCRAAWRSASWWRGRSCTAPPSSSSTSPPPGSTRRAASRCGRSSASCTARARPSSSPRTTWRRPTSSAAAWPSSTAGTCSRSGRRPSSSARPAPTPSSPSAPPATSTRWRRCSKPTCRARNRRTRVDSTVVVEVQAQTGVLPLVFSAAERHGFEVSDLSVTEPTLETVFINLTGKDLRE